MFARSFCEKTLYKYGFVLLLTKSMSFVGFLCYVSTEDLGYFWFRKKVFTRLNKFELSSYLQISICSYAVDCVCRRQTALVQTLKPWLQSHHTSQTLHYDSVQATQTSIYAQSLHFLSQFNSPCAILKFGRRKLL